MLILVFFLSYGCGGGGSQSQIAPTPGPQDFAITLSSNSLSVPQGGASSPVNVLVNPQNGFAGSVQITLSGLPSGVVSNPASPFTEAEGVNTPVVFGALPDAATGSFTITAQGLTGSLSHSASFALAVQSSVGYTAQVYPNPGLYKFLLYDQKRQFLYLGTTDHVDVFDLQAAVFKTHPLTLWCPSRMLPGPCADADLRGLALTSDGSQLIAADFGSQNVFLLEPDSPGMVTFVPAGGVPGFPASGPSRVAATITQNVFVGLSAEGASPTGCPSCLAQFDLTATPPTILPAPQPAVTALTGSPLVQAAAAGRRVFLSFATPPGGPLGIWDPTRKDFQVSAATEVTNDLSAAADGTLFATVVGSSIEVRSVDSSLQTTVVGTFAAPDLAQTPGRVSVPGIGMHSSGALVYQPFLTGPAPAAPSAVGVQGGVDILDARTGQLRLRVLLPEPLAMLSSDIDGLHGGFVTVDENGQKIFALTTSGLTVVQLTNVPLGIGTVFPVAAPASAGATLTIRGSGFQTGTTVTIGGKTANVALKDMNTLTVVTPSTTVGPQQIVLTNPDGENVTLDAVLTAN